MEKDGTTTILLVEDQELTRLGLKLALNRIPNFRVIAEAEDGLAAVEKAIELKPNVVVMDIGLPGIDGVEATHRIKKAAPEIRIIMVTTHDSDEDIFSALKAGADGYCLKNIPVDQLAIAISTVTTGAAWLDPAIAGRVLKASGEGRSTRPLEEASPGKFTFSRNEQEILALVEQGLSYEQIATRLGLTVEHVKSYMCQILEGLVISKQITGASVVNDEASRMAGGKQRSKEFELHVDTPPVLSTGAILADRYVIEKVLGTGGMSTVYKARHMIIDKPVAVKVLHAHLLNDKLVKTRFLQEAKTVSRLNHPNIVKLFDYGITVHEQPYLVMDFIEGKNLEEDLRVCKYLEPRRAVHVFSQVLDGLAAAHAKGVIHRDLKPSNIMLVDFETTEDFAMIIDFGIAILLLGDESPAAKLTPTGEVYGSLAYMSPEQCRHVNLDGRSDLYSLACVMYEAVTGEMVFRGTGPYEIISKHLQDAPKPFAEVCPERHIPHELEKVVMKALAKSPDNRFKSALDMKKALLAIKLTEEPKAR
jgi:DNA-binding NarL/FixJ family response regulator/tRNA A-37 threonylcarbamoyl transferase component Bud32